MKTGTVVGSHGTITINQETGEPIEYHRDTPHNDEYENLRIVRFDLDEYVRKYGGFDDTYDILDLGYWHKFRGVEAYEPPEPEFRKSIEVGVR